jgi:hypothetical protein
VHFVLHIHQYSQYYTRASTVDTSECQQWFNAVDRDRSGSITPNELQSLSFGGRPLGYPIALKLVKVFDRDRNGNIDFREYVTLHMFLKLMQQAFAQCDRVCVPFSLAHTHTHTHTLSLSLDPILIALLVGVVTGS